MLRNEIGYQQYVYFCQIKKDELALNYELLCNIFLCSGINIMKAKNFRKQSLFALLF